MNSKARSTALGPGFSITKSACAFLFMWSVEVKEASSQNFWQQTNGPANPRGVTALAINASGHLFAGTDNGGGVFRSISNGAGWSAVNSGLGLTSATNVFTLAINESGHLFAGSNSRVWRSMNNGDSWTVHGEGGARVLAINSNGHIFAGTDNGVFRNSGSGWQSINNGFTARFVFDLAISPNGHIFAGTFDGGVLRSINNGDSWTAVNSGLQNTTAGALAINSSGHIFAGTWHSFVGGYAICRSMNNGNSWAVVDSGLNNTYIAALAINADGHIFAGTNNGGGVLHSTNNGDSWTALNSGLGSTSFMNVISLAINPSGYIFCGTLDGKVFRSLQPTTAVKTATEFPATFELAQNYPNPFNPSTTIEYALPNPAQVELKVYDTLGHNVRTLVNGRQPAGKHRVLFEARDFPAGLYFYRIKAGEYVQTRKFTLLK